MSSYLSLDLILEIELQNKLEIIRIAILQLMMIGIKFVRNHDIHIIKIRKLWELITVWLQIADIFNQLNILFCDGQEGTIFK